MLIAAFTEDSSAVASDRDRLFARRERNVHDVIQLRLFQTEAVRDPSRYGMFATVGLGPTEDANRVRVRMCQAVTSP